MTRFFSFFFYGQALLGTFCLPLAASPEPSTITASPEEALFVRRILSFWQDKEFDLVRIQIPQFYQAHPQSAYADNLWLLLGDLEYSEQRYGEAASAYANIHSLQVAAGIRPKQLESLYRLHKWDELTRVIDPLLAAENGASEKERLYYYYGEALLQLAKANGNEKERNEQYAKAKEAFEHLLTTAYREYAIVGLAEIHQALNQTRRAAELYLSLVESSQLSTLAEEDLLLKAAALQMGYDKDQAIQTLSRAADLKGKNSSAAVESQIGLLFEAGKFKDIIKGQEEWRETIPADKQQILDLYVSRSYFSLQQYEKALDLLKGLSEEKQLALFKQPQQKAILLTLIASAYHLNLSEEAEKGAKSFEAHFPQDPDLAKALYLQALTDENGGKLAEAEKTFKRILETFPSYEQRDSIAFEMGRILFKQRRWPESRAAFQAFVEQYPNSIHRPAAAYDALLSLQQQIAEAQKQQEPVENLQKQLLTDITKGLQNTSQSEATYRPLYLLQSAHALYELKRHPEAFDALHLFIKEYSDHPQIYQAHLLLALCYERSHEKGDDNIKSAIAHAERALELHPEPSETYCLHAHLFKSYFQLAQESPTGEKASADYLEKARDSLYIAYVEGEQPIGQDYALWLGNEMYRPLANGLDAYAPEGTENGEKIALADRAAKIFEKALQKEQKTPTLHPETLALEPELFKLSCIYGWQNERIKQIALLQNLRQQQEEHPDWAWKLRPRTLFALGCAYEAEGDHVQALALQKQLIAQRTEGDTYLAQAVKLHHARLLAASLPKEQKNLQNPDVQKILSDLKDLQVRKILLQEPLHLEAAIDYAFFRSSLESPEKQPEQLRLLLLRAKTDFTQKDSIWAKDYAANRERFPEKERIYQAYLMLMDAHMAAHEAEIAKRQGKRFDMEQKREAAKSLYQTLLHPSFAVSKYLVDQAQWGLSNLEAPEKR